MTRLEQLPGRPLPTSADARIGRMPAEWERHAGCFMAWPGNAKAWAVRGDLLTQTNQPQMALESYDSALALDPKSADAMLGRACALFSLGNYDQSLKAFEGTVKLYPGSAPAWSGWKTASRSWTSARPC